MATKARILEVYEELAGWYDRQGQAKLRDWFLVLAADAAISLGQEDEAERLRKRLLVVSPHHLLKPFPSFADALMFPDVQGYIADLRTTYPLETAERLLQATYKQTAPAENHAAAQAHLEARLEERELKVFRGKETSAAKPPAAAKPSPPAAPPKMPLPVAWTRPDLPAGVQRPRAGAAEPAPFDNQEQPGALDYWVSVVLFVLMLAGGVGLAFYTLVWPFFSGE